MAKLPALNTERLILRAFAPDDATAVQRLAGDHAIADTTLNIPHPYREGMAAQWIATHAALYEKGEAAIFAITLREGGTLIGAIGLHDAAGGFSMRHQAEIGYWVGVPYWGQGYCTEAARTVIAFAFDDLSLARVHATHLKRNPASGAVMRKLGMVHEGCRRHHAHKWGRLEDLELYGLLREEWLAAQGP